MKCEYCAHPLTPCIHAAEAMQVRHWWCRSCNWDGRVIGRERLLTVDDVDSKGLGMATKSAHERAAEIRRIVEESPGIRAVDICEKTGLDKGMVSKYVQGLRQAEELVQKPDGRRRSMGLYLTSSALKRKLLREKWR